MTTIARHLPRDGLGAGARPRIALVGCGRWGRHVLRDLAELSATVVVVDPSAEARAAATASGAAAAVAAIRELPEVTAAIVATPTSTHAAVIGELLERPIPIFCEKPLTADVDSAAALVARAADRLFVMDKWRYHPGIEYLREMAASGELGVVRSVDTVRHGWANPHGDVDGIWILAPHDLTIVREILGRLPDPVAAVGHQRDGRACELVGRLGAEPVATIDVSVATSTVRPEVRVAGGAGTARLPDAYSQCVEIDWTGGATERRPISTEPPLRRELRHFLAYLAGGEPPKSRAADGLAVVSALHRLRALAGLPEPQRS